MRSWLSILATGWLIFLIVSFIAFQQQGMVAGQVFFADIGKLDWRAQFNIDLLLHLLLFATWVAWRHSFRWEGFALGAGCVLGGGLFTLAYLLVTTIIRAKCNIPTLLLGTNRSQVRR